MPPTGVRTPTHALSDNPNTSINAPVSLQLVAPRWEDERLMAALKVVDEVVNSK
jgi:Asp-tRNA(Asn)/Glu-tRNA(Gln) amidotransferase A subunit family amidase